MPPFHADVFLVFDKLPEISSSRLEFVISRARSTGVPEKKEVCAWPAFPMLKYHVNFLRLSEVGRMKKKPPQKFRRFSSSAAGKIREVLHEVLMSCQSNENIQNKFQRCKVRRYLKLNWMWMEQLRCWLIYNTRSTIRHCQCCHVKLTCAIYFVLWGCSGIFRRILRLVSRSAPGKLTFLLLLNFFLAFVFSHFIPIN